MNEHRELEIKNTIMKAIIKSEHLFNTRNHYDEPVEREEVVELIFQELLENKLIS